MLNQLKNIVKQLTPPVIWNIRKKNNSKYGFFGNYFSWQEALKDSDGYDTDIILNKVKDSLLQVKEGKAIYERDSVLFDKVQYSFPLLAVLLKIALENEGKLNVLDFGGALGSSYYQCKKFLIDIQELHWNIVEQPKFVKCGKEYFKNEELNFYENIETCLRYYKPDIILLSSVIQYIEKPYDFLKYIIDFDFKYVVVDITSFFKTDTNDCLTVQKIPPTIYSSSYPAWILNINKFLNCFASKYSLVTDFPSLYSSDLELLGAELKGFIFESKKVS